MTPRTAHVAITALGVLWTVGWVAFLAWLVNGWAGLRAADDEMGDDL